MLSVILDKEKEVVVFAQTMKQKRGDPMDFSFNDKTHFSSIILNAFAFFQLTPRVRDGKMETVKIIAECYSEFQRFRQAKFDSGGSILSSSQFLLLPQLPQKMKLASKVVEIDSK